MEENKEEKLSEKNREEKKVEEIIKEENKEEKVMEERKKKTINFLKKSSWIFIIALIVIILFNVHIRSHPIENLKDVTTGNYTLGPDLDPFLFLRYAKIIVSEGSLPKIDMMRYVPLGFITAGETELLPYMIVYTYKIINLFKPTSVEYVAVIFPVIFSIFTTIFFFLLVRKIFEKKEKIASIIAIISTAFLVVLPSLLPRTIAGIPEKESAGFGLMFAAFYFFLCAWKAKNTKNMMIYGILSGIFTGSMGLIWGGWIFALMIISVTAFIAFLLGKVQKKESIVFSTWLIFSAAIPTLIFRRYTLKGVFGSTSSGLMFFVFIILITDLIIFHTKIKNLRIVENLRKKIPDKAISLIISFITIIIISSIIFGPLFIPGFASDIVEQLTSPYNTRLMFTVAENRQPFFSEWKDSFGPSALGLMGFLTLNKVTFAESVSSKLSSIPLFFWMFFIGSIFLFSEMIEHLNKKNKWILTLIYTFFIFATIFSRSSPSSILNGTNFMSIGLYFGGIIIFLGVFGYVYYEYYKEKNMNLFREIDFSHLFLFIFFFIALVGARSAIRLIMVLGPVGAIISSYFVVSLTINAMKNREKTRKIILWIIVGIVILVTVYVLYIYFISSNETSKQYIPSSYNIQWQKAMGWVRENTPVNSVFGHWWDYGYWVQTIGQRATMLDGGNAISYWNYLMGRHVLTGESEQEALELLYNHNVSYFLIDSTDIGKYSAYSNIGSDENYDRFSWIGTFSMNEEATQELKNETQYIYYGGVSLDEDYLFKEGDKQIFLPSGSTGIGAMILRVETNQNNFKQPEAIFVYQGQQYRIPMRYVYYKNNLYDFKSGYEGCLYIIPRVDSTRINEKGVALFLSERNMRALWVRLYLLGEGKNFQLVRTEQDMVVESLKSQGMDVGDFVFYNGIRGPIKIWKVNYEGNEKINPEYLQTDYPERIVQRKYA